MEAGVLGRSRAAVAGVRAELAELDIESLSGAEVAEMVSVYAELGKLAAAGTTLAAGRIEATKAHEAVGARSPSGLISDIAGISSGAAERMIEMAGWLKDQAATASAFRSGVLSAAEAEEISRAATRNKAAEQALLDAARSKESSFRDLRNRCNATQSPSKEDDEARAAAARAKRDWRNWVDADGVGHFHAQGPADRIGLLVSRLQARADVLFDAGRKSGERQSPGAYRFDALLAFVEGADAGAARDGATSRRSGVPGVDLLIRIDFSALVRGYVEGDEVCEIAGVGPVPVSVAAEYLGDATLKFILANGTDIRAVAHAGRGTSAHLRSALLWKYRQCATPGCTNSLRLEFDHRHPLAKGGVTSLANLQGLCHACHAEKTKRDYPNGTAERWRKSGAGGAARDGPSRAP